MKCYRVLFKPDDTAFMVWAEDERAALTKARERNRYELDKTSEDIEENYLVDEFSPSTNGTGIMAFYDCYAVYERKDVFYDERVR